MHLCLRLTVCARPGACLPRMGVAGIPVAQHIVLEGYPCICCPAFFAGRAVCGVGCTLWAALELKIILPRTYSD